ncbi:MAG: UDP-N-acetylmuramoyl-L-alanyl-D-glutamate--2,6-diaminopimelate ligase [Acidobacteriota bacterium]
MPRTPLSSLLEVVPETEVTGNGEVAVTAVECDSRRVRPGALFAALRGWREDGHRYLPQAIAAGATAVLSAEPRKDRAPEATWVRAGDERAALARIARRFHGDPDLRLALVGITGTKGKTTTAWLLESMVQAAGGRPGGVGTVRIRVGSQHTPAWLTTPDAPALCGLLARMVEEDCSHAIVEVSSQALDQRRVEGLQFQVAVFTNLTQDHLDYHGTMEAYLDAKARLFRALGKEAVAVLPADDPVGARLAELTRARVLTYALGQTEGRAQNACWTAPEIRVEPTEISLAQTRAVLRTPRGSLRVRTPLTGRHNLRNLAAAAAAAWGLGLPAEAIASGCLAVEPIPGRMERVDVGQPFLVVVDYAHTEDALRQTLASLRELTRGRLLCVFGCGGDRDRGKRAPMGAAAAAAADQLFLTSDNPRGEDPLAILREIERGVRRASPNRPYEVLPDRAEAIRAAICEARPGDAVLIAGKGHEREQILADRRIQFDDREQARRALRSLARGRRAEGGA